MKGKYLKYFLAGLMLALCSPHLSSQLNFSATLFSWMERTYSKEARLRVERLQQLVEEHRGSSDDQRLSAVNGFFNKVKYSSDAKQWAQKDYWATPFEVLGHYRADCEDYALSKYFSLISMGVPEEKLRITYVKSLTLNEAHMVLAYYPSKGAEPLILDNLMDKIRPAGKRKDLKPVYSFNGAALWLSVNRVEGKKVGGSGRIKRWKSFQKRLNKQMQS